MPAAAGGSGGRFPIPMRGNETINHLVPLKLGGQVSDPHEGNELIRGSCVLLKPL